MTRCGCSEGTCPCNFEAGPGILITGNGRRGNPFVIERNEDDPGPEVPIYNGLPTLHHPMFGADKGGVVDDSYAVGQWLAAVVAGEASGYAPQGRYLLDDAAQADTLNAANINLHGDGEGVTEFIVPASNTTGGILLDGSGAPRTANVHFSDFSVMTRGVGAGTGIKYVMTPGGDAHHRTVSLRNIRVYGENPLTDVFHTGIDVSGTWRPLLSNVIVGGPWGVGPVGDMTDASPLYVGNTALKLDDAYAWLVRDSYFWAYATGISDIGTNAEGGRLLDSHAVAVRVGFDRLRTIPEPGLRITGCHVNYRDTGFKIDGSKVCWITDSHIYNQDVGEEYSGTPRDIWYDNCERTKTLNNFFHYPGPTDRINVHVDGSTLGRHNQIRGNSFGSGGTNAILVSTNSENVQIGPNDYPSTYTKKIQDNSGTAIITEAADGVERLENQGLGAAAGPVKELYRDSVSPAASDYLGRVSYTGNDSAGNKTEYAAVQARIVSPTNTTESSSIIVMAMVAGVLTEVARFKAPAAGELSTVALVNRSGALTSETLTYGAVDTMGAGFRGVRIPN